MTHATSRRDFLALLAALPAAGLAADAALAQATMPSRRIPGYDESLPVIGLGSSKVVEESAKQGEGPLREVLRTLVVQGGKVVDTWPRNADNDARFGRVINEPELRNKLFVTTKVDRMGKEAGIEQFRQAQRLYGRSVIDLTQIFSLTDVETHWPTLRGFKDAGETRYIGVTVSEPRRHADLEAFLRREKPDFIQTNYSITERQSEERILPLAAERGVAVLINRPFMNGTYFRRLEKTPLPPWAAEFGATSWAQFSLKYILANPALTGVLTETADPQHMEENARAAFGPLPNEAARAKMRAFMDAL